MRSEAAKVAEKMIFLSPPVSMNTCAHNATSPASASVASATTAMRVVSADLPAQVANAELPGAKIGKSVMVSVSYLDIVASSSRRIASGGSGLRVRLFGRDALKRAHVSNRMVWSTCPPF